MSDLNRDVERGFEDQFLASAEGLLGKSDARELGAAGADCPDAPEPGGYPGEPCTQSTYDWREEQRIYNRRLALEHAVGLANSNAKTQGKSSKLEDVIANATAFLKFFEG